MKQISRAKRIEKKQETQLFPTNRATHLYKCNGMAHALKQAPSTLCYNAEFGSSTSTVVGISRESPQSWGGLGPRLLRCEAWLIYQNHALPTYVTLLNLVGLGQSVPVYLRRNT